MTEAEVIGPIEVWLRQDNMTVNCMIVKEDETTGDGITVESLSMRGAQREMTGWFINQGYEPVGRWEVAAEGETLRRFKPKA